MSTGRSIPVTVNVTGKDTTFTILIQLPLVISREDVNLLDQAVQELKAKDWRVGKTLKVSKIADQHLVIDVKNWSWNLFKRRRFDAFIKAIVTNRLPVEAVIVDSLNANFTEHLSTVNLDKWLSTSQGVTCVAAWCENCGWTEEMTVTNYQESDLRGVGKQLIRSHTHASDHCDYPLQFDEC